MNTELIVWLDRRFDKIEQKLSVLTEQLSSLQPIPPNRLVDIKGAAAITRFKPSYIYGLVHQKKIPHVKFGHSVRFDPRELDTWMRQGRPEIEKLGLKKLQEMERTKFKE